MRKFKVEILSNFSANVPSYEISVINSFCTRNGPEISELIINVNFHGRFVLALNAFLS